MLQQMFEVFEFMRGHGRRPGPETCYILVKGCVDHARPDLAEVRAAGAAACRPACLGGRLCAAGGMPAARAARCKRSGRSPIPQTQI